MQFPSHALDAAELVMRLAAGDARALARAISLVENGASGLEAFLAAFRTGGRRSRRIGVTGAGGAGKSTLVDQMVRPLRSKGERVAVVAIDPSSPFTGGALLGDRIRMQGFSGDDGVFIRSMASRGEAGGVAKATESVCLLLEAAGFETILLETVGVGQAEVAVTSLVDATILILVPGMGDDVQSLKAGIMEAADVYVVNKADQPGADKLEAEIRAMQSLSGQVRPVLRTNALSGDGVSELLAVVERFGIGGKEKMGVGPTLDHVGIAVRDLAGVRGFYEKLGAIFSAEEVVTQEQVKVAMAPLGQTRVELLEATADDSVVGRFVARRGEGLHHIALRVDGVDRLFEEDEGCGHQAGERARADRRGRAPILLCASGKYRWGAGGVAG